MNIDDLSWQANTLRGVSTRVVLTLIDHGHLEVVIQAALEREDWHCARTAVTSLCSDGQFERALDMLAPFTATGWHTAQWLAADVMTQQGRGEEALAMTRPDPDQLQDGHYCSRYAELAVAADRADLAIEVLTPHLDEAWLLRHLVEVTDGQDRDEQMLQLLTTALTNAADGYGVRASREEVLLHTARVLGRSGRPSEALALLRAEALSGGHHTLAFSENFAELLARQGLTDELATLAADDDRLVGAYTAALTEAGRDTEAEALLRERIVVHNHDRDRTRLMTLLGRQDRIDEAVEVGLPMCADHENGATVHWILELLVDDGRPGRALEVLDNLTGWWVDGHPDDVQHMRLRLLGEAGRHADGIAHANALPQDKPGQWDPNIADLLEGDGRTEEAIALLRSSQHRNAAEHLADLLARY
ncbi:hypothetical protein [Kitasatospora sp. NPDC050463]|uniref:tetratricopeptide repeat protein n=1 Tax=Kitasatospora sp. NPDC050463 TaxID=3155786 RepID=UPI0033F277B8